MDDAETLVYVTGVTCEHETGSGIGSSIVALKGSAALVKKVNCNIYLIIITVTRAMGRLGVWDFPA